MGSILVVPVYLLGKELFSAKSALVACIVTAVCEPLVAWSCEVMTQATYLTFALTGIYLVWVMMRRPSPYKGAAAGTVLALAFLTRPEGLLLFFVMPIAPLLLDNLSFGTACRCWQPIVAALSVFLALI